MTDKEGDGQQAGAQETIAPDAPAEGDVPAIDPKVEAEAKEMGWKPKEAWKGDPDLWRPAEDFVKRGREIIPILNARLKESNAALEKLKKDSAEQLDRVSQMGAKALKMQREQLEARYDVARERAVEQGDTKTFNAVEKAKKDALAKFDAEVEPKKTEPAKQDTPSNLSTSDKSVMDEWMKENSWYSEIRMVGDAKVPKNPVLFAAANEAWDELDAESPGMSVSEKLAEIKKRVVDAYPTKFGSSRANGAAKVEGANGRGPEGGDSTASGLWAKVPKEIRDSAAKNQIEEERVFDHLIGAKKGQPLTPAQLRQAREKYAELYFQN
jgi:hypothetical protein